MDIDIEQGTIDGKNPGEIPHEELVLIWEKISTVFGRHLKESGHIDDLP